MDHGKDIEEKPTHPKGDPKETKEHAIEFTGDPAETKDHPLELTGNPVEDKEHPIDAKEDPTELTGDPAKAKGNSVDAKEDPTEPTGDSTEAKEDLTKPKESTEHTTESMEHPIDPERKWHWEVLNEEEELVEETESENCELRDVGKVDLRHGAHQARVLVQQTCGSLLNRPSAVADLFILGWRCWFLFLKTLETALGVSPRSSPYSLDLLCSLKNLSLPQSRDEARCRVVDNYASYSGEYFWLLRSLVCFCVCRFASPWRVGVSVVFLAVCGFVPLEDRRVGPYVMQKDLQRVFLVMVAVCGSGVVDVVSWCLLLACPAVLLHLFLHNSRASHQPLFSNLLRS
ncbi:hypothetical protein E2C01_082383 [Portunus trituberculatus]|uniref:PRA1 family protein n=1 Tax=Portunus trituberculatus TaxID=210409 RepID=A0A5B7IS73_PORTR|nr:hypothetical protein [Portunus trituberculatus]